MSRSLRSGYRLVPLDGSVIDTRRNNKPIIFTDIIVNGELKKPYIPKDVTYMDKGFKADLYEDIITVTETLGETSISSANGDVIGKPSKPSKPSPGPSYTNFWSLKINDIDSSDMVVGTSYYPQYIYRNGEVVDPTQHPAKRLEIGDSISIGFSGGPSLVGTVNHDIYTSPIEVSSLNGKVKAEVNYEQMDKFVVLCTANN